MKNTKRKGFTIVELVIVIAVIAILAAVLIPTFASLINKANRSADIQAVHQMNTLLATYTDGSVTDVLSAIKALDAENIDLEDYKALQSKHYFYFVLNENGTPMIIYADENDNIVFPENLDKSKLGQWMSLSGDVPMDDNYTVADNGSVDIDSGAKLAHLMATHKDVSTSLTITLKDDVDLKGSAYNFKTVSADITIKAEGTESIALKGLRADENSVSPESGDYANHNYGFGIFGNVKSGTVKLENVTISGLNVGNSFANHEKGANTIGLVAGYIQKGATVELNGVTFKDCVVNGYQKVGGIVGQLHGTLNMTGVKFENVSVNGTFEVAKVAGIVNAGEAFEAGSYEGNDVQVKNWNTTSEVGGNLSCDNNCDFTGISVNDVVADSIVVKASQIIGSLKADDSANTFAIYDGSNGIWGATTNDLAWYVIDDRASKNESTVTAVNDKNGNVSYYRYHNYVTVNGTKYQLVHYTYSTSKNITDGKPATN